MSATTAKELVLCPYCGGNCKTQEITLPLRRGNSAYTIVQGIPAEVCQECGEPLFSLSTTRALFQILHEKAMPEAFLPVPLYHFQDRKP